MKTYTAEQLAEIIKKHGMWLRDEDGGERADLRYANLSSADLRYADLRYADLSYADLRYAAGNREHIKSIFVSEVYPIVYTVDYLQIGCERHLISDWSNFDDRRILEMDGKRALEFWKSFKDFIFMSIKIAPASATGFVEDKAE